MSRAGAGIENHNGSVNLAVWAWGLELEEAEGALDGEVSWIEVVVLLAVEVERRIGQRRGREVTQIRSTLTLVCFQMSAVASLSSGPLDPGPDGCELAIWENIGGSEKRENGNERDRMEEISNGNNKRRKVLHVRKSKAG